MRTLATLAALLMTLAAVSGDRGAPDDDTTGLEFTDVRIDIGRLALINDKTQEIWQKLRSDENRRGNDDPAALNAALRRTVWQFNELREDLCLDRFMVEKSCGPPYVPTWAYESSKVAPSAAALRKRQEELADHVEPLWDAACDRLRKIIANDVMYYCSIE